MNRNDERGTNDDSGDEGYSRWLMNEALAFWRACAGKRCRRARSCLGDAAACHARLWPRVPEATKAWWRALQEAREKGRSPGQAKRAAAKARAEMLVVMAHRAAADRALAGVGAAEPIAEPLNPPREFVRDSLRDLPRGPRVRAL